MKMWQQGVEGADSALPALAELGGRMFPSGQAPSWFQGCCLSFRVFQRLLGTIGSPQSWLYTLESPGPGPGSGCCGCKGYTLRENILMAPPGGMANTVHKQCRFYDVPDSFLGEHTASEVCLVQQSCNSRAQVTEAGGQWRTVGQARLGYMVSSMLAWAI